MAVVAIDPGETTGLVWIDDVQRLLLGNVNWQNGSSGVKRSGVRVGRGSKGNGWVQIKERTEFESIQKILKGLSIIDSRFGLEAIILESFQLKARNPSTKDELLAPVRINAVLDYHYSTYHAIGGLIVYSPTHAKSTMNDERLKFYGLLFPGKLADVKHARDAGRHLLKYALDHKKS